MRQELLNDLGDLTDLSNLLKGAFVSKDELIELLVVCAIAQEHLLIVGPPGTAKSELVKRFALLCSPENERRGNGKVPYFEYLLTRFTEPAEIFGPLDIAAFQAGQGHRRVTDGMLPRAEMAFLDEVFKSNSAILNALLTLLNERVFYNGGRAEATPLLCAIGATNEVPEDEALSALFDRFLVRIWTDNVEEARFGELFQRGWQLERDRIRNGYTLELGNVITTESLRRLYLALDEVDLEPVARDYREVVRRIRAEGISLSDRRVIKLLKLVAAAALRRQSTTACRGDFWVLKHVWNDPQQIPHLQSIIEPYLEAYEGTSWSAERDLAAIQGDINVLGGRRGTLRTDADYADFLQQAGRLRRELMSHSDHAGRAPLLSMLKELIDGAMAALEKEKE
jgi:MoxR-like ATPase